CQQDQWVAPLRHLVTQDRHLPPCANTPDGAIATPARGRHARGRGSSPGSQAERPSAPGSRPCWPLCNSAPNSNTGDGGYAGQDRITYDSICTCGAPHSPSRPLRGVRIIRKSDAPCALDARMSCRFPSAYQNYQTTMLTPSRDYKFNPLILDEIQTGADIARMVISDARMMSIDFPFRSCPDLLGSHAGACATSSRNFVLVPPASPQLMMSPRSLR